MRPLPKNTREILFEGTGPLGSFSAKVHLGFALSLYNDKSYADLRIINRIRNIFAHEPEPKTFATAEIASRCKTLNSINYVFDPRKFDPRKRARKDFQNAIFFYMTILSGMAEQPSVISDSETPTSHARPPSPAKSRKRPHPPGPRRGGSGTES
jgi:DNA-binding MltR family transcriptional regulator